MSPAVIAVAVAAAAAVGWALKSQAPEVQRYRKIRKM